MSRNYTGASPGNNASRAPMPHGFGNAIPIASLPTATSRIGLRNDQIEYAIRSLVRIPQLSTALQIGVENDRSPISEALLDEGRLLLALVWDACRSCHQRYGNLADRALLHVAATGLRATSAYQQVSASDLQSVLDYCYSEVPVTPEAGRNYVADVIERYAADRPEAIAWSEWTASDGEPPRETQETAREIRAQIDSFREGGERRGPYTTEEFRALVRERVEIISGVLVANQLALVGAATKSLKTLISLDAAVSIATGMLFLNHPLWDCRVARRVGFFSAESGADTLLRKYETIASSKRSRLSPARQEIFDRNLASNMSWDNQVPDLSDPDSLERLRRTIADRELSVIFVDPLSMAIGSAGRDLANFAVAGQVILRAAHICQQAGCTLVLIHHTAGDRERRNSGRGNGPLELTDVAYPAVTNHARQWLTLNRAEAYDEETRRSSLWLRAGGSGCQAGGTFRVTIVEGLEHDRWEVSVQTEAQSIAEAHEEREYDDRQAAQVAEGRILDFIRDHPGCTLHVMTRGGNLPGIGAARLRPYLNALESRNVVRGELGPRDIRRYYPVMATQRGVVGGASASGE